MSTDPTHAVIAAMVQAHLAHSEQHRAMADAQLEFIDVIRTAFSEVTGLLENLEEEVEVLREVVRTGVGQDGRGRKRRRLTGSPAFVSHTPERDYGPGHGASIPSLSTSPSPTSRLVSLPFFPVVPCPRFQPQNYCKVVPRQSRSGLPNV